MKHALQRSIVVLLGGPFVFAGGGSAVLGQQESAGPVRERAAATNIEIPVNVIGKDEVR